MANTMSNYNDEMNRLFVELGMSECVRNLTDEEKATKSDWRELENIIDIKRKYTDAVLTKSMVITN